ENASDCATMVTESVPAMLQAIRRSGLLSAAQLNEVRGRLALACADAEALAKILVEKHWLTSYQAEQILDGQEDELVFGPYQVLSLLGEGGLSRVCKAWNTTTRETVALKIL